MSKHLKRDLGHLKRILLEEAAQVEEAVQKSIIAFQKKNVELADEVIKSDVKIDESEVEIEEQCLKSLALHQPFAQDLRFITSVLKINNDFERMGDCASNIAKRTKSLTAGRTIKIPEEFNKMTTAALDMVKKSLESFINRDVEMARWVCQQDDVVDTCHRNIFKELRRRMRETPEEVDAALDIISIAKHVERIADLSTNIAEDVVYLVEGEIIRHART